MFLRKVLRWIHVSSPSDASLPSIGKPLLCISRALNRFYPSTKNHSFAQWDPSLLSRQGQLTCWKGQPSACDKWMSDIRGCWQWHLWQQLLHRLKKKKVKKGRAINWQTWKLLTIALPILFFMTMLILTAVPIHQANSRQPQPRNSIQWSPPPSRIRSRYIKRLRDRLGTCIKNYNQRGENWTTSTLNWAPRRTNWRRIRRCSLPRQIPYLVVLTHPRRRSIYYYNNIMEWGDAFLPEIETSFVRLRRTAYRETTADEPRSWYKYQKTIMHSNHLHCLAFTYSPLSCLLDNETWGCGMSNRLEVTAACSDLSKLKFEVMECWQP